MIQVDNHEPYDIPRLIEPVMPVSILPLNDAGWADYVHTGEALSYYPKHDGHYQTERKTCHDIATDADGIEVQLRKQRESHPEAVQRLIIEGAIEPAPGGVMVYTRAHGKNVLAGKFIPVRQHGYYAKLRAQIDGWQEFLEVIPSTSYPDTASILVALYNRDQKPEEDRGTFRRYFKDITWHPNPQVEKLLGVASKDSNIGVKKAEEIIQVYGTCWAVLSASPQDIATKIKGISVNGAREFLRKLGRLDV